MNSKKIFTLFLFTFVLFLLVELEPVIAQTVNCPYGYICTPICPVGYICTPLYNSTPTRVLPKISPIIPVIPSLVASTTSITLDKKVSSINLSSIAFSSIKVNSIIPLSWITDVSGVQGIVVVSLYRGGIFYRDIDSVESMGGSGSLSIFIPQTILPGTYRIRATFINISTDNGPYAESSEFKIESRE